jgi:ribosomal protein S18 acetylase RimI-like enzyme
MSSTSTLAISPLEDADIAAVVSLWQRCGLTRPWNEPQADIALARRHEPNSAILLGRDGDAVVASVLVGHDGHRGAVYYVAVDPDHRNKGLGRTILSAAEDWLRARGILKLNLMVRADNTQVQAFYETQGYDEQERIVYAKWLDGRDPTP